ncbi:MAG: hypothetical protein NTY56_00425 [Patescibacteria group bacterium]|nr:hypothetical protein [Patescibacteria group bacterium]
MGNEWVGADECARGSNGEWGRGGGGECGSEFWVSGEDQWSGVGVGQSGGWSDDVACGGE